MKNNAYNFATRQHTAALMRYKLGHVLIASVLSRHLAEIFCAKTLCCYCALSITSIAYSSYKLTVSQLVNEFPTVYGNPEFITLFRRAKRLITAGSMTNPAYIIPSVFKIHFNITLSSSLKIFHLFKYSKY